MWKVLLAILLFWPSSHGHKPKDVNPYICTPQSHIDVNFVLLDGEEWVETSEGWIVVDRNDPWYALDNAVLERGLPDRGDYDKRRAAERKAKAKALKQKVEENWIIDNSNPNFPYADVENDIIAGR
mgnify:CR=1 FL=1